jgi:type I restriction enzyme, S subunit
MGMMWQLRSLDELGFVSRGRSRHRPRDAAHLYGGLHLSYLYMFVTTDEFVGHLVNHTTGTGYPAVRPDDFKRASMIIPSDLLLKLFHEKTEPMFRLIIILEKEARSLAKARDLLLPRLMNGEITI